MDKAKLLCEIEAELNAILNNALAAAEEARSTATNKENAAENKYDTLGLEAAYLAHGQSERVLQLEKDLAAYMALGNQLRAHHTVAVGSLIKLENEKREDRLVFIGPASGGLGIRLDGVPVTVITSESPLGRALLGAICGDEVSIDLSPGSARQIIKGLW